MAKDPPATKSDNETPFQRFQRLAKKLATVPKREIHKRKGKEPSFEGAP